MNRTLLAATLLALTLALAPASALALEGGQDEPSVGMKLLDATLVRPPSLVAAAGATAVYLATLPLTWPTGIATETGRYLLIVPWRWTSARFLGDFHTYKDGRALDDWNSGELALRRGQYRSVIEREGFEKLVEKLETQIAELSAQ